MTEQPSPVFYTIPQISELLQVSERTVRRWLDREELQHYKLGRQVRIEGRDLRLFLAAREQVK